MSDHAVKYRPDIDGLRSVAVLPVVFFHAGAALLSGGFVGVDVFFVISGFLITSMIAPEAREGRFSIASFYERRIRRIYPALIAMVAVSSVLAWFLLTPSDMNDFGHSVVATSAFSSNVLFWLQADYFDGPAHLKPLLHTWSLAVEEQFYIVFPLFLVALNRFQRERVKAWTWACFALSLVGCIVVTRANASTAFYMAPLRGWELLTGSLLALGALPRIESRGGREVTSIVGLGLIAWSVLTFSDATAFPGAFALAPVLGAAAIIHAGTSGPSLVGRGLSLPPVVFIGKVSYSLYLWHWPLIVFAGFYFVEGTTTGQMAGVLVASALLSVASWRFVEQPFRARTIGATRRSLFTMACVATVIMAGAGLATFKTHGWPSRVSAAVRALDDARKDRSPDRGRCHGSDENPIAWADKCKYGSPGAPPTVAIWGDSFAAEPGYVLADEAKKHGASMIYISGSACPPAIGLLADTRPVCEEHNVDVLKHLVEDKSIRTVLLISRYENYEKRFGEAHLPAFAKVVDALTAAGKDVVITYPIPKPPGHVPTLLARYVQMGRRAEDAFIPRIEYERDNARVLAFLDGLRGRPHVSFARPQDILCDASRCALSAEGQVLYYDENHLSLAGARRVLPAFDTLFSLPSGASAP
jgi:peptidoglycan/LPS O-acetylase OafA/YrhL